IFTGLIVGPTVDNYIANLTGGAAEDAPVSLFDGQVKRHEQEIDELTNRNGGENPYIIHQELGEICTRACTVVRKNSELEAALTKIDELDERYQRIEIVDRGQWSNQNLVYARNVGDMLTLARVIAQGALQRDECRGAHYKPEFDIPAPDADEPAELRRQVTEWCKAFQKKNERWLKTTIAEHTPEGPKLSYEPVDVSLIPPRPRTYGLKGAELIDQVWQDEFVMGKGRTAVSAGS
ncbi:MAG: succinate dehydrogenase flavoprotein subunit, partial [Planctomycetes bacterium]|nr:succinate dehydrogenase flavoprotein subunit [Planctomycetota bacterium]